MYGYYNDKSNKNHLVEFWATLFSGLAKEKENHEWDRTYA